MGRYILNVVCFFLCPDADCLRNNLYGAIKSEFERVLNMNKEWSELNKTMQAQIKKKDTYKRGIDTLLTLRSQLIQTLVSFKEELCREDFNSIPFINADGYHSKTIAYSIWHIFRIEDIVVHTVIHGACAPTAQAEPKRRLPDKIERFSPTRQLWKSI